MRVIGNKVIFHYIPVYIVTLVTCEQFLFTRKNIFDESPCEYILIGGFLHRKASDKSKVMSVQ